VQEDNGFGYGSSGYFRISIGAHDENAALAGLLRSRRGLGARQALTQTKSKNLCAKLEK
jgi:hypothetical protein